MRLALGLDLPERRVGLSAHDFAQLLGTRRGDPVARRQARRRADGRVALHAAARRGRRQGALEGGARARRKISRLGARSRPQRNHQAGEASASDAAAQRAPGGLERHADRGSAARSLHDLRTAYPGAPPARCGRHAARRARPRHRDPRRDRRLHREIRQGASGRPARCAAAARRSAFRGAAGLSGSARVLVAALPAHRALVHRLGGGAARRGDGAACGSQREPADRDRHAHVCAAGRAPTASSSAATAATRSSTTRPARRRPNDRCAPGSRRSSRWKARSCARAASRRSPAGSISEVAYVALRGGEPAGEHRPIEFKEGHARRACRPGARHAA